MKTTMLRQILISAFFVICLLTGSADAFDASDAATRLDNVVRKSLLLEQSILSAQKSSSPQVDKVWECLNELYYRLEVISARIDGLYSIVAIASSMNDKSDEQTVVDMLNEEAASFLPVQIYCECCGRKSYKLAYFDGQNICPSCYWQQPKELRDAVDAAIEEAERAELTDQELTDQEWLVLTEEWIARQPAPEMERDSNDDGA